MHKLFAGLAALLLVALGSPSHAEIRALIVAVSQYTAPIPSLEGPPNDAAALKNLLEAQGAKDIVTLRDAAATRANIRGTLESLGKRSKAGDWVIF
ncbi:MAG TPA: caspase family protein, partial [Caulobacteraceae bacterium]|nr:caspase family protein [Caulobacteraceae bacterium]